MGKSLQSKQNANWFLVQQQRLDFHMFNFAGRCFHPKQLASVAHSTGSMSQQKAWHNCTQKALGRVANQKGTSALFPFPLHFLPLVLY